MTHVIPNFRPVCSISYLSEISTFCTKMAKSAIFQNFGKFSKKNQILGILLKMMHKNGKIGHFSKFQNFENFILLIMMHVIPYFCSISYRFRRSTFCTKMAKSAIFQNFRTSKKIKKQERKSFSKDPICDREIIFSSL